MQPLCLAELTEIAALDVDRTLIFDHDEVLHGPFDVLKICSSLITVGSMTESQSQIKVQEQKLPACVHKK
jgi:hypothetical protein